MDDTEHGCCWYSPMSSSHIGIGEIWLNYLCRPCVTSRGTSVSCWKLLVSVGQQTPFLDVS